MKSEVYALAINQNQNWENPDNLYESAMIVKKDKISPKRRKGLGQE